jgi:hypothetical protein
MQKKVVIKISKIIDCLIFASCLISFWERENTVNFAICVNPNSKEKIAKNITLMIHLIIIKTLMLIKSRNASKIIVSQY